ncbi:MAG: low affinity iron permease family protein [Ginsengibacter sp.]
MKKSKKSKLSRFFNKFSGVITKATGGPMAFIVALLVIIVWAVTGPVFKFSDTWQLVINTSTTIITFLMVFVIQHSQNKDTMALQLKLNELIAASHNASNRLIAIEDLTEEELEVLKKFYIRLAQLAKKEKDIFTTHSIDEAHQNTLEKIKKPSALTKNVK